MSNGTTFHFVDNRPQEVLAQAVEAAKGQDVVLGGGPSTIRQFLEDDLVDELHLVIAPVLLGSGERLFDHPQQMMGRYMCEPLQCAAGVADADLTCT